MISLIFAAIAGPVAGDGYTACTAINLNPATLVHLQMNPVAGTPVPPHGDDVVDIKERGGNGGKSLGYTRIRIAYAPCAVTQDRAYWRERRSAMKRFFLDKSADKLIKLKATIRPLGVDVSSTIGSIQRRSGGQGEEWSTTIENDRVLVPYFRVDRSSFIAFTVDLSSSRTYNASVASNTLDIVKRAATLIAPTSALVTKVNKARFNDASSFVDSAINGMLKVAINERAVEDVPLNPGAEGAVLAVLTANLPTANDTYPSPDGASESVGRWIVFAERLRPSMFGDVRNDRVERRSTTPAAILNYLVDDTKTLREAFTGVQSLGAARDALIAASDAETEDRALALCRTVAAEGDSLGLTPIDAGASVWAYLTDMALPEAKMERASTACAKVEHYPD